MTYGALARLRTAPRRGVERERGSGATKRNDKKTRTLLHHRPARQRRREPPDTTPAIATRPPRAPRASTCRAALRSIKNARRVTWRVRASERAQPRAQERRSIRLCIRVVTSSAHTHQQPSHAKLTIVHDAPSQSHFIRHAFGFAVAWSFSTSGPAAAVLCRAERPRNRQPANFRSS